MYYLILGEIFMLKEHHENQDSIYKGTVIDIETKGEFCDQFKGDSREYKDLQIVVFGYINKRGLHIYCAKDDKDISILEEKTKQILGTLDKERPLYAYNCQNEMSVFFHRLNLKLPFDGELQIQSRPFKSKETALRELGIFDSYGDPFKNEQKPGKACGLAWMSGHYDDAIKHNRACLLKEQRLLMEGHVVTPIPIIFNDKVDSSSIRPFYSSSYETWTREKIDYIKKAWNDGKTIKNISQDCKRTCNAIWMRFQKLGIIPQDIPFSQEKESWTFKDLP